MSKLNSNLPVILIDTSYWLYYRFFSLRNWYARAYPEKYANESKNSFNTNHNWLEDEVFMSKYKKLFIENIKKLCKKYKTKLENVVFCIDCSHNEIWRHKIVTTENNKINEINEKIKKEKDKPIEPQEPKGPLELLEPQPPLEVLPVEPSEILPLDLLEAVEPYKGKRKESHKKNNFNSFNIFTYMKKSVIPLLKDNNNNNIKIINCSCCEADDIIGQLSVYIENKWKEQMTEHTNQSIKKIYILANDNDYLQVCNTNIKLINGIGKIISSEKDNTSYGTKYLLSKILLGDKSDNIKCCTIDSGYCDSGVSNNKYKNITNKYIKIIFDNPDKYELLINLLNDIRNNKQLNDINTKHIININKFKHNINMMDFQMLPLELKQNLNKLFDDII
jgi:5'-3' exonuclease